MRNRSRFRHSLLFLVLPLILTAIPAYAAPTVTGPFLFTENYGPNGVGVPAGYYLAIGAQVQDSGGVPGNIESVDAFGLTSVQTIYHLPFIDVPIFPGLYQAFPLPPYTGQLGQWRIEATNKQGEKATALTPVLDKPLLIPLARNLRFTVTGNPETPTIEWDPVLFDNDLDPLTPPVPVSQYRVRFVTTGNVQFFRSGVINPAVSSYVVPPGVLTGKLDEGVYVRFEANHFDGPLTENRSDTFTDFLYGPYLQDACPDSDHGATIVIDGCDTGVKNDLFPDGCTISDLVHQCAASAANHGKFVSCVAELAENLKKDEFLSGRQKGAIEQCTANAGIP